MARRKVSSRAGSAWDREFLGDNRYNAPSGIGNTPGSGRAQSYLDINAVRRQAGKLVSPELAREIIMTIETGDDSELLPYQPTPTINPGRPRTLAAGYDERSQALRIRFRDGEIYTYYNVPPSVWWKFQRAKSPGRFINSTLNNFPYSRGIV